MQTVYVEEQFPSILFAKDGEVYDLNSMRAIAIGGAYSIDWMLRIPGRNWWPDEQPYDEVKTHVENNLDQIGWKVDVVLSHTVPLKYAPVEQFLPGIDQQKVDKSTERWLDSIEERLQYRMWYAGHYHTTKRVNRLQMEHVWDGSVDSFSNSIRVHISSLRKKLKAALGYDPILNRIGEGYLMGGREP